MTSVVQQRWATRELVGDKQHVQIVRVRPGYMNRYYGDSKRIDDGSTPFNGSPIYPPLIWKGQNHSPFQGFWNAAGPWVTLPNVESTKWTRSFDIQTGGMKGTSTLTTVMDNIAFPEESGIGGLYHTIVRGYYSPQRGYTAPGRPNVWPHDTPNEWQDVLDSGYQIELWEGYGSGSDVTLLAELDPTTNSYAPASGALDRTWTGIVTDLEGESHPDMLTITAQDFGIFLTDQRLVGSNKPNECRSPITFADRRQTQGEKKLSGPYHISSGSVSEDGVWTSENQESASTQWIEMDLPAGYYEDFFVAPTFPMNMYVSLHMGPGGGTMDRAHPLPAGWVELTGPTAGTAPDGTPYMFEIQNPSSQRYYLGHGFDVTAGSKLRLTFTPYGVLRGFNAYRFGTDPAAAPGAGVSNAKGWILVDDAAEIVRILLIWAGFKEWVVEDFTWSLYKPLIYGEDKFFMDVIVEMLQQGSFIFYMGPPSNDDRSLGRPHFEHLHALDAPSPVLEVRDTDMVEALDVKTDLSNLPWVMRYRGVINKSGVTFGQDLTKRVEATYYPPWTELGYTPVYGDSYVSVTPRRRIAGIHRHFTETMSLTLTVALTTPEECLFACVLAAIQYGLNMQQGQFQIPGLSRLNLNDTVSVMDEALATNQRMWVTSIESDHVNGGADNPGHWTMTISGSMLDNEDMAAITRDYRNALKMAREKRGSWSG